MKIVVCIKQVPDTNEVKLDPVTNTLIREGVPSIINNDDKSGIEAALELRDKVGGTVTVVCMGPPQADVALREALAMGCDEAILVSAREFGGSDTWAQVGPQIAETLGVPQVSYVEELKAVGDVLEVKRQFEDRYHIIEVKPPCLLTALSELAEPRYMSVGGIVDAYEKEIQVLGFDDLKDGLVPEYIGLKGSPTNVVKSFTKEAKGAGEILKDTSVDDAVEAIMNKMKEKHLI